MMSQSTEAGSCVSKEIQDFCETAPKGATYLAEAEFGLRQMIPVLDELPTGARVLEVGSGPCIVLTTLAARYPDLYFQGIEPMGSGFALFESFLREMAPCEDRFTLFEGGYEDFPMTGDWDLIFLVNVFEHLPDWADFLDFVQNSLAPDGRCIVLCPNYGFPYEPHFSLPVVGNKRLTETLFRRRIEQFERRNGWDGLYASLNFVKLRQVRRTARNAGLTLTVQPEIVLEMVERLDTDLEFAKRQKSIAGFARALRRSGLLEWLVTRPAIQNLLPYMKLELSLSQ
jgi:SAM-dependent methyltransferase